MPTTRKGIVFSIDALLAAILLSLFVAGIAFLSSSTGDENIGHLLAKQQASDALLSMDKSGVLAGMDNNRTNMTLEAMLPQESGYLLDVEYYYSGNFSLLCPISSSCANGTGYGKGNGSKAEEIGLGQRDFVVAKAGQAPIFGVAKLSVWKGS